MSPEQKTIQAEPTKVWNLHFIYIFLANATMYLGQYMIQTLVTKYAATLGAAPSVLAVVASAFALTALIFKLFSGPALDTFERKYIIFGSMLVLAAAFFGYSFATSVELVIVFRLVQGAAQAFTATGYLALAADALPRDQLGSGLGIFTLAQSICMAVSPAIGLAIADRYSFSMTFLVAAVLMVCAALLSLTMKPVRRERKPFRLRLDNIIVKEALLPMFFLFMVYISACLINSYLVIYATEQRGLSSIGIYFTVNTLVLLVTRPLIGKLTDKVGFTKIFIPALLCFAASFFMISWARELWMFVAAAIVAAFGNGVCHPLINSLCMKAVPPVHRGAGSSTSYIGVDLGNLVGPSLAAVVINAWGYEQMWRVMTLPIFIAVAVTLACRRKIAEIERFAAKEAQG